MAIVLPKERSEALRVFALSNFISIVYVVIFCIGILGFFYIDVFHFEDYFYFIPIYVLFFGFWSGQTYLSIRDKTYRHNAFAKVVQSVSYISSALLLGLSGLKLYGLVIGKILGLIISWFFLHKKSDIKLSYVSFKKLKKAAKKYIDFPKYGVAPSFLNTLSAQALILILTRYYTETELGRYGLTYMILSAPLGLIGTSFKDVFYQRIASQFSNHNYKLALSFFNKSAVLLLVLGLPVCIVILLFGKEIFSFVFGSSWEQSGVFASIMALGFLSKLIASPLSAIFNASNKLKIASVWQITYFITTFTTLGISAIFLKADVILLMYIYVVHEIILYSLYFVLEYRTLLGFVKNQRIT